MELKEFVSQTLTQIMGGVQKSQGEARQVGGLVNPDLCSGVAQSLFGWTDRKTDGGGRPVFLVHFDVVVAAKEATESKGGAGIVVGPVVLGAQGKSDESSMSQSRIAFDVPVALPRQSGTGIDVEVNAAM